MDQITVRLQILWNHANIARRSEQQTFVSEVSCKHRSSKTKQKDGICSLGSQAATQHEGTKVTTVKVTSKGTYNEA